jgi:hypothetical protein
MSMVHFEIDQTANLLKIRFSRQVTPDETQRQLDRAPQLLAGLKPGFRLLTDLSELESIDLACVPHIERMMDLCNQQAIELVVRVIPNPHKDIGLNIMSLFHYGRRVRIVTCESMEEAQKILASSS